MLHECNVFCHSSESELMDLLGKDDILGVGKWLPFTFDVSLVTAVKMTTDDQESMVYRCSTIFLSSGDTYIVDTLYRDFISVWAEFLQAPGIDEDEDLNL